MLRRRSAAGLALLAALLTSLPYLLAASLAGPGSEFSGFLLNPLDGFSYLAKMRQGMSGPFQFTLPYAPEPGPGALLFVYHLALGRLAGLLQAEPRLVYHLARLFGALAMYASAWTLFRRSLRAPAARRAAYLLTLFGTGLGWIGLPFGLLSSDLWIPEAVPFLSAYANAHFALATALVAGAVLLIAFDRSTVRLRLPLALGAGLALAVVQPFAVLSVVATVTVWLAWEAARRGRSGGPIASLGQLSALAAFGAGSAPVLLYDWMATVAHPALQLWAAQNRTPSPSLVETVLGYGLVLLLALLGVLGRRTLRHPEGRLLAAWAGTGLVLMYLPFALQRRMALGLFVPLAGLAGLALSEFVQDSGRRRLALAAVLIVSLPSHLVVIGAGLRSAAAGDPTLVLSQAELEAYQWIEGRLPAESLVLAGPRTGNRIPAFSAARVLYGHPFETPQAERQLELVRSLFAADGSPDAALRQLQQLGVDFARYGPEERELGQPAWLEALSPAQRIGDIELYRIPAQ